MIEKLNRYWNIIMVMGVLILISYFIHFSLAGGIAMDRGVGKLEYSTSLEESEKENTLVKKYFVYNSDKNPISNAWLEYARSYDISDKKTIDKNRMSLGVKKVKKIDKIKNVYWKAFFREKKLTAFEDKGIIRIVGVDKNMDTIILKANKDEVFYIVNSFLVDANDDFRQW